MRVALSSVGSFSIAGDHVKIITKLVGYHYKRADVNPSEAQLLELHRLALAGGENALASAVANRLAGRYNLARVYAALGRLAEAVAELEQVVVVGEATRHPDLASARAMLARVRAGGGE